MSNVDPATVADAVTDVPDQGPEAEILHRSTRS